MKNWREAINKNISVKLSNFHSNLRLEIQMLAKNFYLCSRFCYPYFQNFSLFSPEYWFLLKLWQFYLFCNFFEAWICQNLDGENNGQISVKTPLGTLLLKTFKVLSRNSVSNTRKCQLWHFYFVARIPSHYHILLNNCTKPFINGHLWWVKYPNLLLGYQMCEGHLALVGGPAWKGLWHS